MTGLGLGAIDYLTKPFEKEELKFKIQNQLFIQQNNRRGNNDNFENNRILEKLNPTQKAFLEEVYQILDDNLSNEDFKSQQLARKIFFSYSQLNRKLKNITGKSVGDFIEDYRFSKAKQLLKNPELTITDIALEVGFPSLEYFSKRFKEKFGKPPSELRK